MCGLDSIMAIMGKELVRLIIGLIGVLVVVVVNALLLTWAERKISGHMQKRM